MNYTTKLAAYLNRKGELHFNYGEPCYTLHFPEQVKSGRDYMIVEIGDDYVTLKNTFSHKKIIPIDLLVIED
jgi:hypothetical protein